MTDKDNYRPTAALRWYYTNDIMEPELQQKFVSDFEGEEPEWREIPSNVD